MRFSAASTAARSAASLPLASRMSEPRATVR
jgi:hypothetical protein